MSNFIIIYRNYNKIWSCIPAVASWFASIYSLDDKKREIADILLERIRANEAGKYVEKIGLQEIMSIKDRYHYLLILRQINIHIQFIRACGFELKYSVHLAIFTMCDYYREDIHLKNSGPNLLGCAESTTKSEYVSSSFPHCVLPLGNLFSGAHSLGSDTDLPDIFPPIDGRLELGFEQVIPVEAVKFYKSFFTDKVELLEPLDDSLAECELGAF